MPAFPKPKFDSGNNERFAYLYDTKRLQVLEARRHPGVPRLRPQPVPGQLHGR